MAERGRAKRLIGPAALVGIVLAGAVPMWFRFNPPPGQPGQAFAYDLIYYYYPMVEYAAERLATG